MKRQKQHTNDDKSFGLEGTQWAWNWLDHWMSSQPYNPPPPPYPPFPTAATTTPDNVSDKITSMIDGEYLDLKSYRQAHKQRKSPTHIPSYMAPTASAKAKVRDQGTTVKLQGTSFMPYWNSSTKNGSFNGSGCDSSSSGGAVATGRSPNSKTDNRRKLVSPNQSPVGFGKRDWRHDH